MSSKASKGVGKTGRNISKTTNPDLEAQRIRKQKPAKQRLKGPNKFFHKLGKGMKRRIDTTQNKLTRDNVENSHQPGDDEEADPFHAAEPVKAK